MYVEICGGLTSRLLVLSHLWKIPDIKLVWRPFNGIQCEWSDLFSNGPKFYNISENELCNLKLYTYGIPIRIYETEKLYLPLSINRNNITHIENKWPTLDDTNYVLAGYPLKYDLENFIELLNWLKPTIEISNLVDKYYKYFNGHMLGINIRGCNNTINYSNLSKDINIIKATELIRMHKKCFLSTGSQSIIEKFREYRCYNNTLNIIFLDEEEYPLDAGYTPNGVKRALVDFYLLSKTNIAYIPNSGYAIKACLFGRVPFTII